MSFEDDLRRFAETTGQSMDKAVRQAVILAAQGVVMMSPVGNPSLWKSPAPKGYVGGRFRANWNVAVGAPNTSTTEETDKGGGRTLQKIIGMVSKEPGNQVFYLTNSLPYAERLEYGHSTQASGGFVRITFMDLPRRLEAYAATLNKR